MSERLHVCQALAAMLREHGEPNEEEVTFIGMAAMQLGLSAEENEEVQKVLKDGGAFDELLGKITSKPMRAFFLRRMLAASLLDEQINEAEQAFIDKTAETFEIKPAAIAEMVAWMRVAIDVEKRLGELFAKV